MTIVLIHFYLQHLKLYCLFLFETRDRPSIDSTAIICWWASVRAKQLSMAAIARVTVVRIRKVLALPRSWYVCLSLEIGIEIDFGSS